MTLVNDPLYSHNTVSQYVERAPRYSQKGKERDSTQWQQWLKILVIYHRERVIKSKVASKVEVCPMYNENHDI